MPDGEEGIWVLRVELECLSNVRPAHGTRREAFVSGVAPAPLKEKPQKEHGTD